MGRSAQAWGDLGPGTQGWGSHGGAWSTLQTGAGEASGGGKGWQQEGALREAQWRYVGVGPKAEARDWRPGVPGGVSPAGCGENHGRCCTRGQRGGARRGRGELEVPRCPYVAPGGLVFPGLKAMGEIRLERQLRRLTASVSLRLWVWRSGAEAQSRCRLWAAEAADRPRGGLRKRVGESVPSGLETAEASNSQASSQPAGPLGPADAGGRGRRPGCPSGARAAGGAAGLLSRLRGREGGSPRPARSSQSTLPPPVPPAHGPNLGKRGLGLPEGPSLRPRAAGVRPLGPGRDALGLGAEQVLTMPSAPGPGPVRARGGPGAPGAAAL